MNLTKRATCSQNTNQRIDMAKKTVAQIKAEIEFVVPDEPVKCCATCMGYVPPRWSDRARCFKKGMALTMRQKHGSCNDYEASF